MSSRPRFPPQLALAMALAVPGSYLGAAAYFGLPSVGLAEPVAALVYGAAIVGAAFILSWAAEAVQVDINAGLALALLALLAILPEYAVDFVFTAKCGAAYSPADQGVPEVCSLALANMTGANRILVGIGWPLIVLVATVAVWRNRRRGSDEVENETTRSGDVRLQRPMSVEVLFLGLATVYSLTLPLKSTLTLWDSLVFVLLFAGYAWRLAQVEHTEPDLLGVSAWIGHQPAKPRRAWVIGMFTTAAVMILLSAEHFAESLVATGDELGISKFLLVQWLAPLASESPELLVASIYAWRLKAADSFGTLLSSKVNQWTLLVGSLPLVFSATAFTASGLPLDTEQRYELLITAAQSLFAVALLIDLRFTFRGAVALMSLFSFQFLVSVFGTAHWNRITIIALSMLYAALALVRLVRRRRDVVGVVKDGLVRDLREVAAQPAGR